LPDFFPLGAGGAADADARLLDSDALGRGAYVAVARRALTAGHLADPCSVACYDDAAGPGTIASLG